MATDKLTGVIIKVNATYGFIAGDDTVERFFIPSGLEQTQRAVWDDLRVGMKVEFTHINHSRGPRAIEVRVIE